MYEDYSPYSRQLHEGFKWLRFEEPLEEQFRLQFLSNSVRRIRRSLGLGLLLVGLLCWLDWQLQPNAYSSVANMTRLLIMVPAILLPVFVSYAGNYARWLPVSLVLSGLAVGGCTFFIGGLAQDNGVSSSFAGLSVVTVYIYLFLGLRFYLALIGALPLMLLYTGIAIGAGKIDPVVAYHVVFLGFSNIIGAHACYMLEYSARTIFLENRILNALAGHDGLTGVPNRRLFNTHLTSVWGQARRDAKPLAICLIDIDYFKNFNDHYGHQAGDDCLRQVAQALMGCARRPLDFTARYGGEELAMVLYDAPRTYIEHLVNRVRTTVVMLDIAHEASPISRRITVTIGVAAASHRCGRSMEGVLQLADEALYEGKGKGRNQIVYKDADAEKGSRTGVFKRPRLVSIK